MVRSCRNSARRRIAAGAALAGAFALGAAPGAGATVRIVNHNDPAGDPTRISYNLQGTTAVGEAWGPFSFSLVDGDNLSYGPPPGTYVAQALLPANWRVADIQCVGHPDRPDDFVIDVPNGRVTFNHATSVDEQTCSFTNSRVTPFSQPASGVAPAPPASEVPPGELPRVPALLRVFGGHGYATATVRIPTRSVIRASLLRSSKSVGVRRVVHRAGTWTVRIPLRQATVRQLRREGRTRITLTLRLVVAPLQGTAQTFRYRVIVRR
jgi:hypothetical protein